MPVPFADVVTSAAWRAEAEDWIKEQLASAGSRMTGEITQPRVRPWSTQLSVPTDVGILWFKANCPDLAFEPALHATLSTLEPDEVDEPFAVDRGRGWMLTRDRGRTLLDSHEPTLADWQAVVTVAARMQRRLAKHQTELLDTGLPYCSPASVPERYDVMIERLSALPEDHPSHLPEEAAIRLRDGRDEVSRAVELLSDGRMPSSFQHGDLHPGNVFVVDGGLRVFATRSGRIPWRSWQCRGAGCTNSRRCRGSRSSTRMRRSGLTCSLPGR
jgi:Phosphotransferase enzyme family